MQFTIQKFLFSPGKISQQVFGPLSGRTCALLPSVSRRWRRQSVSHVFFDLCTAAALCATLALCPATARAQNAPPIAPPSAPHAGPEPNGQDSALRQMTERMARERNSDLQKKIVTDTARLLAMAKQLNAEVSHTDKNVLSLSVVEQAGKIEKLAKSIKEKMRDGY